MSGYKYNKAWRKRNSKIWQSGKTRYYKQFEPGAHNSHQRYTTQADDMIMNKKFFDRDIAAIIGRSVKAIQVRRSRLR